MPSSSAPFVLVLLILLAQGLPALTPFTPFHTPFTDDLKNRRFISASKDGTLYFRSRVNHWKLSTGSPLWHSEQEQGLDYYIFYGEDWKLYEYNKDTGVRKLNSTIEELVRETPYRKGSVYVIGSLITTLYYVDADSGETLYADSGEEFPDPLAVVAPGAKQVLDSSNVAISRNAIVIIARTDYSLSSLIEIKPLWNVRSSHIIATWIANPGLPCSHQSVLPVLLRREETNSRANVPNSRSFAS